MNKSIVCGIISLFLISLHCDLFAVNLSKESSVYLLTCSSGEELYSVFGHSAIRVKDDSLGVDLVFNYGTFDFDTPNFYGKFMNGDLNYMLSYTSFDRFIHSYRRDGRGIRCGLLDLTYDERQNLWSMLLDNIKPENKFYRYDFFFDNCATRIRDIVFKVKGLNSSDYQLNSGASYRDYLHALAGKTSWKSHGVDLVLGVKADKPASFYERAYIPQYLDSLFHEANIIKSESTVLTKDLTVKFSLLDYFTPTIVSLLILFTSMVFFVVEFIRKQHCKLFDIILFTSVSLVGLLLLYLGLLTKHTITEWNMNCLWASIIYIPTVYFMFVKNKAIYLRLITIVNNVFLILLLLLSIFEVQVLPFMAFPISAALFIRNVSIYIHNR